MMIVQLVVVFRFPHRLPGVASLTTVLTTSTFLYTSSVFNTCVILRVFSPRKLSSNPSGFSSEMSELRCCFPQTISRGWGIYALTHNEDGKFHVPTEWEDSKSEIFQSLWVMFKAAAVMFSGLIIVDIFNAINCLTLHPASGEITPQRKTIFAGQRQASMPSNKQPPACSAAMLAQRICSHADVSSCAPLQIHKRLQRSRPQPKQCDLQRRGGGGGPSTVAPSSLGPVVEFDSGSVMGEA